MLAELLSITSQKGLLHIFYFLISAYTKVEDVQYWFLNISQKIFFLGVDHELEGKKGTFFSSNSLTVLIQLKTKNPLNPSCYTVVDGC